MLDASLLDIGPKRQFLFDDLVIESVQNLTRRYHSPEKMGQHPSVEERGSGTLPGKGSGTCLPEEEGARPRKGARAPLLVKDRPWEMLPYFTCNTWNVIRDPEDGLFKCWYENWLLDDPRTIPTGFREADGKLIVDAHAASPSCICYAQSEDGIAWEKPELDLVVEDGRKTNIVLGKGACGDHAHCAYVFLDPFEGDRSRRFKAMFECGIHSAIEGTTGTGFFAIAASPDGIHWEVLPERLVFGATQNVMGDVVTISADPASRTYWSNNRHPDMDAIPADPACASTGSWLPPYGPGHFARQNKRRVFRSQSADLVHWSHPHPLVVPDEALDNIDDAFYGMEQFQIGDDWLGLLNVFHMTDNTMDVQLVYSRDGREFRRVNPGRAWLCAGGQGAWDAFMVTACSKPVTVGDDLYVYHGGAKNHHDWWFVGPGEGLDCDEARDFSNVAYGLGLATMKRDRFVSLGTCPVREGVLITRPLRPRGTELVVNVACREGGSFLAEITDPAGRVLDGFEKEDCVPFNKDAVEHTVRWKAGKPIRSGEFLRVRFFMRKAEIFSFEFVDVEKERT